VNNQSKNKDEIKLPVQVWDGVQDSELPVLNFVGKDNKWENTGKVKICMSNSFAFGGANSCLIIGVK
jgi:3-oxoacyl-[acyl-carrier-protein] synthase-1